MNSKMSSVIGTFYFSCGKFREGNLRRNVKKGGQERERRRKRRGNGSKKQAKLKMRRERR